MENIYYNYVYIDPRHQDTNWLGFNFPGQPFYVGKGKGKRAWVHLNESAKYTHNILKYNKIQRIKDSGCEPIILIIYDSLTEQQALQKESMLISEIGTLWNIKGIKKGPLCNMTSGGEGRTPTDELRDKCKHIGAANGMYGKKHTSEAKQKISVFRKQFRHSDESKQKMKNSKSNGNSLHCEKWLVITPTGEEICTNYLLGLCEELNVNYNSLYNTYVRQQPISRGKSKGYRLQKIY